MRIHRFYLLEEYDVGQKLVIRDARFIHQLTYVLRARISDQIILFNNQGEEAEAVILEINDKEITVAIQKIISHHIQLPREVTLYCALLKRDNFEWVLQKATELGVHRIVPLLTNHTIKQGFRADRLQTILIEAAEQCGRTDVPILESPQAFSEAVQTVHAPIQIFFGEASGQALAKITLTGEPASIFIGPEGGWSDEEREVAEQHKLTFISLSPLTLRAETAAIVGVSLLTLL